MIDETDMDNSAASTNPASNPNEWSSGTNNNACGTTKDKIFLLSEKEATTTGYGFAKYDSYGTENTRIRMTTDFAKASGAYQHTTAGYGGIWWLRSPSCNNSSSARSVNGYALANGYSDVYLATGGVCPALCIN